MSITFLRFPSVLHVLIIVATACLAVAHGQKFSFNEHGGMFYHIYEFRGIDTGQSHPKVLRITWQSDWCTCAGLCYS